MGVIKLTIIKGKQSYDMSELVQSVSWSGRKGSATRVLTATLLDSEDHDRSKINPAKGHRCIFKYDGNELFRGIIMKISQTENKHLTFTAYDNCIYLANNRDSFSYKGKTASDIFVDLCKRAGMKTDIVDKTSYKIKELVKPNTTYYDVMLEALSRDYKNTGERHYIFSEKGKLSLKRRKKNIRKWIMDTETNIMTYNYESSIENVRTRIKVFNKDGKEMGKFINSELEKMIGRFQDVENKKKKLSSKKFFEYGNHRLDVKGRIDKNLSISAEGIADVYAGVCVYVKIKHLNMGRTFYIDEDSHTFQGSRHTMNLSLNFAQDINKIK